MSMTLQVRGLKESAGQLDQLIKMTMGVNRKSMTKAVLLIQRESQKLVPVDTGNLRSSSAVAVAGEGNKASGAITYGANYAVFVHERRENKHKPGKQAKFLQDAANRNRSRVVEVFEEEYIQTIKGLLT